VSPVTHFFTGWVFANLFRLDRRDRALVTVASVAPDLDGLGIIPELLTRNSAHPLLWFSQYHHSLHTLAFAVVIAVASAVVGNQKWKTAALAFVSFHLHLIEDVLGSRGPDGYQWPIPYLKPFSDRLQLVWHGQWALNAWPNVAITVGLLLATFYFTWKKGLSPLEMFSSRAELAYMRAFRYRFPNGGLD